MPAPAQRWPLSLSAYETEIMRSNTDLLQFEVSVDSDQKMRLQPPNATVLFAVLKNSSGVWTSWQEDATPWMGKSIEISDLLPVCEALTEARS